MIFPLFAGVETSEIQATQDSPSNAITYNREAQRDIFGSMKNEVGGTGAGIAMVVDC